MPNYAQAAIQIRQKKEREARRVERELRLSADYTALLLHPPPQVGPAGVGGRVCWERLSKKMDSSVGWFFEHSILSRIKIKDLNFFYFDKKLTKVGQFFILFRFLAYFPCTQRAIFYRRTNKYFV
jgi:hypothetical protein